MTEPSAASEAETTTTTQTPTSSDASGATRTPDAKADAKADAAAQDKAAGDKAAQQTTAEDKAKQDKADQNKAEQDKAKQDEAEKAEKEKAEAEKAADPASWDLKIPDGVTVSDEQRVRINDYAKAQGLTQAQIEAGIPVFEAALQENLTKSYGDFLAGYETQAKADPQIGGPRFAETVGQAEAVVKRYGAHQGDDGAEALDVLRTHGMLSHPAVLRFLKKADDATRDDRGVTGGDRASAPAKSMVELMYPNSR